MNKIGFFHHIKHINRYILCLLMSAFLSACGGGSSSSDGGTTPTPSENTAPVANAGNNQNASVGMMVTLNGSASNDADGDTLTYNWSLSGMPDGSEATLTDSTLVSPSFTPDIEGNYDITLIVNDGTINSAEDTIRIMVTNSSTNAAPIAHAFRIQNIQTNSTVNLSAVDSIDFDNDMLTYQWNMTSKPDGSSAVLSSMTSPTPNFSADTDGEYTVDLTVNDGTQDSETITVVATASSGNSAPVAQAGRNQFIPVARRVWLSGIDSSDADNDNLTFNWHFISIPEGSNTTLEHATQPVPSFIVDVEGVYAVNLIVNDGVVDSAPHSVQVISSRGNNPPMPHAGPNQHVGLGAIVNLSAEESSDADGQNLTYTWAFTYKPEGSTATFNSSDDTNRFTAQQSTTNDDDDGETSNDPNPTFTADKDGTYILNLTVDDGTEESEKTQVSVTVSSNNSQPVANAGEDKSVTTGDFVKLSGVDSTDGDNDNLSYTWSFTSVPNGSSAILRKTGSATPQFTTDVEGTYVVSLTVNDGTVDSETDYVSVTASSGNSAPIASAGDDQNVTSGTTVSLSAEASSDADGDILSYTWNFSSLPSNSSAQLSDATSATPSFTTDFDGSYILQLTVNDGSIDSEKDSITITASSNNSAPTAKAGKDQNVSTGDDVTLKGGNSEDADGDSLTYLWSFTSKPAESSAQFDSATRARPTFTADIEGTYVFSLVVNDGTVDSNADTVTVIASSDNSIPVSNAGADQSVTTGTMVSLSGTDSSDADGDNLTYQWAFTSIPTNSQATLSDATSSTPSFATDQDGSYIVQLMVSDETTQSDADSITITASSENSAPIADAGSDQLVTTGSVVNLSGANSSDANQDELAYQWQLLSMPNGSSALLSDSTNVTPSFTADIDGDYVVSLTVNDGTQDSEPDSVTITSNSSSNATKFTYTIVDTGQSLCYDTTSGDEATCTSEGYDADYTGNQPSYTVSSDNLTVYDNNTGLTWQQSSDQNGDGVVDYDDKMSQSDANAYCDALTFADRSDWRLPSIQEAYSLILFTGEDASSYTGTDTSELVPFIDDAFDWAYGDQDAGDRVIDAQYATTTLYVSVTMNNDDTMFGVNYVDGRIKGYPTKIKDFYVRCVTDNTSYGENDFVNNNDQTITDNATGLMWQQNDSDSTEWDDAVEQCESAETAGYNDWRLPNTKELHSILDYTVSPDTDDQGAINSIFNATSIINEEGETDWAYYWTSTTHANYSGSGTNAAYISFGRALGLVSENILDVHGAGAQRSNDKNDVSGTAGGSSAIGYNDETYYYHGPQGDILRHENKFRCVRDTDSTSSNNDLAISTNGTMNILLIIGDDIGVDNISGYKEQPNYSAQTPSIDSLANEGVLFRNAWTNAMCSPSRASLLTGRHAFRHGVTYPGKYGDLDSSEQTLAEVLSSANYKTALFGKWHLGAEQGIYPTDQGFDYFSGSLSNIASYFAWDKTQISAADDIVHTIEETNYASEVVATESLTWILEQTTPWFAQVAFNAPHSPFHVPPSESYSNIELSGDEGDVCNLNDNNDDVADCYRAAAEAMDTYIGELLEQIPTDTLSNTMVIFVGDNGTVSEAIIEEEGLPFLSEHSKGTMYEGGVNVPMVIWAGDNIGLDTGEITDNVQLFDLFSTIIEIAGSSASSNIVIDGMSLVGYLDNETETPNNRDYQFSELFNDGQGIDRWAVSNGSMKYIYNEGTEECYDLVLDPSESTNLYDDNATNTTCDLLKENKPD